MKHTAWLLGNILWFGVFVFGIFYRDWPAISLAIPVIFHWRIDDIK